jgi:hypothetical protein
MKSFLEEESIANGDSILTPRRAQLSDEKLVKGRDMWAAF